MSKKSFIIAIDGMSAAYKTTVAKELAKKLTAEGIASGVIHCDDFFLPMELRTAGRLSEPGGNIHYERLKEEVIDRLLSGEKIAYHRFDCSKMDFGELQHVPDSRVYIVEGAYALHPYFAKYYDLSVFMKVSGEGQLERIQRRNGNTDMFEKKWIPLEDRYQSEFGIEAGADMVIDTTEQERDAAETIIYTEITKRMGSM